MPRWNGGVIGAANNPTTSSAKGIWSLSEATKAIRAGLWPAPNAGADPYFENVTLLLPGDGTNGAQNNTFLDSSTNAFTITRNGNTTQGTFTPFSKPDGRWSNYFDGSGDYLGVATNAALRFGTGDFTVESWVYFTTLPSSTNVAQIVGTQWSGGSPTGAWTLWLRGTSNKIEFNVWNSTLLTSTTALTANTWYHVAVTRSGTSTKLFINGANEATATSSFDYNNSSYPLRIGAYDDTAGGFTYLTGYLSNLRLIKGTAVYTAAFTTPTAPLTAITNTSLLTCQSNRFIDNSTNAFAITKNGDASVQTFSPFPALTAYSAGTNGGSGYFDEAGDYLATPTNAAFQLGTGDFSIEAWIYPTKTPAGQYPTIFRFESGGYNGNGITFFWRRYNVASTGVSVDCGGVIGLSGTSTVPVGAWTHVAFTRTGNDFALFVNGVREATTNNSNNFSTNVPVNIGYSSGNSEFPGYISSARVVKGSNPYGVGTTLTIPTAPLTAITNTSLLLNFTNGGIVDAAMSNDLETVGNAQISTTQSKWGGSSMYFDGTGDYLFVPNTNLAFNFGTGDFTVEGWIYLSATPSTNGTIIDTRSSDALSEYYIQVNTSSKLDFIYSSSRVTSATSISNTTWTHFAITRSSGTIRLFINGTLDANTASYSSGINAAATPAIGGGRSGGTSAISGYYFNGYIDDLRITKGYARYTASFTAPTAAFNAFGE